MWKFIHHQNSQLALINNVDENGDQVMAIVHQQHSPAEGILNICSVWILLRGSLNDWSSFEKNLNASGEKVLNRTKYILSIPRDYVQQNLIKPSLQKKV